MRFPTGIFLAMLAALVCTAYANLDHDEALRQLNNAGITTNKPWCTDRDNADCTSLDQIRQNTITQTINLKQSSGCDVVVTGGTEVGHGWSHSNGYKVDLRKNSCLNRYIRGITSYVGSTSSGSKYRDSFSNEYIDEGNHWDVYFP